MEQEKLRLIKYALRFGHDGEWLVNGEDCIEVLEQLENDGLIERDESGKRWCLVLGQ